MSHEAAEEMIDRVYEVNEGNAALETYHDRHGVKSMLILTITSAYAATREVDQFASQIRGKVVVEIGAGVGFLALEMAKFAKQVYAIEADPAWNWIFTDALYVLKPTNLTWIFGSAESVAHILRGDVAVIYTRSGHQEMEALARKMCKSLIRGPFLSMDGRYADVPGRNPKSGGTICGYRQAGRYCFSSRNFGRIYTKGESDKVTGGETLEHHRGG